MVSRIYPRSTPCSSSQDKGRKFIYVPLDNPALVVKHENAKSVIKVSIVLFWSFPTRLLEKSARRRVEIAIFQNRLHGLRHRAVTAYGN